MTIGIRSAKSDNKYGDGSNAIGGSRSTSDAWCTMCGEAGHKATAHAGGKAMVRDCSTAGEPENDGGGGHGEAVTQDKATQFYINDSEQSQGNANFKLPGERGGKSIRIFG